MTHFSKFYAISAIYLGLASAVNAQPPADRAPATNATAGRAQDNAAEQGNGTEKPGNPCGQTRPGASDAGTRENA